MQHHVRLNTIMVLKLTPSWCSIQHHHSAQSNTIMVLNPTPTWCSMTPHQRAQSITTLVLSPFTSQHTSVCILSLETSIWWNDDPRAQTRDPDVVSKVWAAQDGTRWEQPHEMGIHSRRSHGLQVGRMLSRLQEAPSLTMGI